MAVKAAKLKKRTAMQDAMPKVRWGEQEADNAWRSRYLGSIFEAGGGQMADVERRVTMAATRFGQMRHMEDEVIAPTAAPTIVHRKRVLHDDIRVGSVVHE